MAFESALLAALAEREQQQRTRSRRVLESAQGVSVVVNGKNYLNFCSNDYLGLANHPKVVEAFQQASVHYGVGSGASHLVCGHSAEHHQLEEELAAFTGRDKAMLFSTGYMANLGVVNALVGKGDAVFEDKLNHASLIDGGLNCGAQFYRYAHNDMTHLAKRLTSSAQPRKLIVTDGIFSMDGDVADMQPLCAIAEAHKAWLMVDDAHGFGVLGRQGGGIAEQFGLSQQQLPVLMGTLGKSFGTFGAFVAGSDVLIETLIQFSRTYIYTTALPPAVAAASRASLRLLQAEHWRREHLHVLIQQFQQGCHEIGLQTMASNSPIQPILIGDEKRALALSAALADEGLWVMAIRPPTVPENTSRLRITFTAEHTQVHVEQLLSALHTCWQKIQHL